MTYLDVPNARLYHEVIGEGPTLLCIPGGNGEHTLWKFFAHELQTRFKVIIYDRRGFSKSPLTGPQDYSRRLQVDVEDAVQLIQHVSPGETANVIGSSSGAIVSLELLTTRPDVVATLCSHEPPAMTLLPDFDDLWKEQQAVYDTYRAAGPGPAMVRFMKMMKMEMSPGEIANMQRMSDPATNPYRAGNTMYWFEREFLVYPKREFEREALKAQEDKLVLLTGRESPPEAAHVRPNRTLGEICSVEVTSVPGGHMAYLTHVKEFAHEFLEALEKKTVGQT